MTGVQTCALPISQGLAGREPHPLAAAGDAARTHDYDWAQGRGHFDARGPLWLDNQLRDGRQGVHAYRIFLPDNAAPLLVDLGWLPLPGDRRLPPVALPKGEMDLRGLLAPPPSAGLAIGPALAARDGGWLLTRVELHAIDDAARLPTPLAPRVLRLDPALPLGYTRDLTLLANTLPPEKHRGYAVQWFALAAAVLVTALILTFRKARHDPAP